MRRVLLPIGLALTLVVGISSSSAQAAAPTPPGLSAGQQAQIVALDQQISMAKASVDGWRAWLQSWSARIDSAELHASTTRASVAGTPAGGPMTLQSRITASERHLDAVVGSQSAVAAFQQLTGWQTQLATLQAQRAAVIKGPVLVLLTPGAPVTYETWAGQLLGRLGYPTCSENITAVLTWESAESTTAAFNPLATTHDVPGALSFNSVGVRDYLTLDQGLEATVATLQDGSPTYGYGQILDSLAACASADQTVAAINASSWCAGCAFGGYVTDLLPAVRSNYQGYAQRLISQS